RPHPKTRAPGLAVRRQDAGTSLGCDDSLLQAEGAALDKDDQADCDQYDRQQDVAPPAEGPGDDRAAGEKPPGDAPDADQDQENGGVHDGPARADGVEDRHIDADVVAAVAEGGNRDLSDRGAARCRFRLLAVITALAVLPEPPSVPQADGDRDQPQVGDGFL